MTRKNKPRAPIKTNLTQADVKAQFDYDAENGWLIRKKDNHGRSSNRPCGHKPACDGYDRVRVGDTMYKVHRIIWLWCKGSWPKFEIDHKDRNKMNNRIENLRDVERKENILNQGISVSNTTGYKGVSWNKRKRKYIAQISNNGKKMHLGNFNSAEEAFLVYMIAKIEHHPTSPDAKEYFLELTYVS